MKAVALPLGPFGENCLPGHKEVRIDWVLGSGAAALVTGGRAGERSLLLRLIAGFETPAAGRVEIGLRDGRKVPAAESGKIRLGYLPPPGEEIFVGTTVEEELGYGLPDKKQVPGDVSRLEEIFRIRFTEFLQRSVWSLSDGERRLLALASQARAGPELWLCEEPLALLDGGHAAAVCAFLAGETRRGITVIAAAAGAAQLIGWAREILIFSKEGQVVFAGEIGGIPRTVPGKLGRYFVLSGGKDWG